MYNLMGVLKTAFAEYNPKLLRSPFTGIINYSLIYTRKTRIFLFNNIFYFYFCSRTFMVSSKVPAEQSPIVRVDCIGYEI